MICPCAAGGARRRNVVKLLAGGTASRPCPSATSPTWERAIFFRPAARGPATVEFVILARRPAGGGGVSLRGR